MGDGIGPTRGVSGIPASPPAAAADDHTRTDKKTQKVAQGVFAKIAALFERVGMTRLANLIKRLDRNDKEFVAAEVTSPSESGKKKFDASEELRDIENKEKSIEELGYFKWEYFKEKPGFVGRLFARQDVEETEKIKEYLTELKARLEGEDDRVRSEALQEYRALVLDGTQPQLDRGR